MTHLTLFDGTERKVHIVDEEIPFIDGCLIVSRTNKQGIITHCNDAFVEMSGYIKDDLIGQPHHILRHPDMPSTIFKNLWNTVSKGNKWHGHVKNLRKDGKYYWVHATAIANIRHGEIIGFSSIRRKPSRDRINEAIKQYALLKQEES